MMAFWQRGIVRILHVLLVLVLAGGSQVSWATEATPDATNGRFLYQTKAYSGSTCISCHGGTSTSSGMTGGSYQLRFFSPTSAPDWWANSLSNFRNRLVLQGSGHPMHTLGQAANSGDSTARDESADIYAYLISERNLRNPVIVADAKITSPATKVLVNTNLTFDGSASTPGTGVTYQWSVRNPGNVTTVLDANATQSVSFPTAGTYRVTLVVTPTGGTADSESVDITVSPPPNAVITSPTSKVLIGTTLTISGNNSTPAGDITYQWSVRDPANATTNLGTSSAQAVTFSTVGTYRISLAVKPTGLSATDTEFVDITVVAPPQAVISSPATSVVAGTTLTISGSASTPSGGLAYQWSIRRPDNTTVAGGTAATQDVTFSAVGMYRITLAVQPTGISATDSTFIDVAVTAATQANIAAPATSVVAGTTLTLDGSGSTPSTGLSYQWSVRNPAGATSVAGTAATQNVTFSTAGTYRVTLTVTPTAGGAPASASVDINVSAPPPVVAQAIITSPPTSVVVGTTLTLSGTTSTPANQVTYQWSVRNPANVTTTGGTAATQNVTFATVGTYRVTLAVQPTAGGNVSTTFADIEVTPTPVVPAPIYSPSGFDALVRFAAAANSSQTLCPTIQNSGTAPLTLSVAAVQAGGSSADFSNYFELGDSTSCPATPRACLTNAAGSPVSGTTTLQPASDSACTLALRFNPAKLGAAGGIGVRTATLRVTHNAPSGTVVDVPMSGNVTAAPQPAIGLFTNPGADASGHVSPPAFASQPVSSASAQWNEFQVFNSGDADGLDLTELANSNAQEFALTENCVNASPLARLSAGTEPSCTVGLRFTPGAVGQRCTTITIRAAVSSNGAQSRQVCGTGVAAPSATLALSADAIDFGRRFISASYPPRPLVISNGVGATDNLQINDVRLSGTGFALLPDSGSSQTPCAGRTLAPGASCTVQVQFTPDPTRPETPYSASIQIDSNDRSTPRRTVTLAAVAGTVATPPVLQTPGTPAQIEFTSVVMAGQQSQQPLSVPLRNAGPGAATIETIRMVGADASSFSASGCQATLQEGDSCTISVRFVPGSGGLKRAQLEVLSSRSVAPPLITVTGRGVGGSSAFLAASAANLAMGSVRVGARSEPAEVRLSSGGDGVVQVTAIEAGGPFTVQPKTCPAPPFTLPRGGDCTVTVTFTPTNADVATASLRVSTDAGAVTVPLTGSGAQSAEVSSGGCSLVSGDAPFDPTLLTLVGMAFAALLYRHRARAARRRQP
ncbi:choice-of-anchor D domain-containing protein [Massilia sp. ZL223]|uniref:choice-of-anchor D domain-containing protein n=1 Tax=Massilia sp. ZL223 TaxID=2824904 RepID=UPI001B812CF1|nr:choice-of-anchor D domain-containing protein [Massilia sp. ZL223]MBQ5963903.1 choice-of-anchor D domain-containing protein [Massilia sp. ZL223]